MKRSETLYEAIEKYVSGKMSGEELSKFEQELSENSQLAGEVRLHQELSNLMEQDKDEKAFIENLKKIDQETKLEPGGSRLTVRLLLAAALILLAWWMYSTDTKAPLVEEKEQVSETIEEQREDLPEVPQESQQEEQPEVKTENKTQDKKEKPEVQTTPSPVPELPQPSQPIAMADYSVNPLLEALLDNNRRSSDVTFTLTRKLEEIKLADQADEVTFRIQGEVLSEESLAESTYNFHVFNNSKEDYRNFLPLYTEELSFEETDSKTTFDLQVKIAFKSGLYYYVIEDADTEETFYVGKFSVK